MTKSFSSWIAIIPGISLGSADAHHSFRMHYDPDRSIELQGVVAEVDLRSPHSFFFVDAPGEDGATQRWEVEAASLVHLRRLGIHPDTFQPGDAVESSGYPSSAWGPGIAVHPNGSGADVPSSAQKTVVERYSIGEDDTRLVLEVTHEDPVYMREPYSARIEYSRVSEDTPWYDYVCEVDSAERFSRDP